MERKEIIETIVSHKKELDLFGVKSLAIFGSVARGEATPKSDIDILVEFHGRSTFRQYMELKFFLEELLGCPVDLVTPKSIKPRMRPYVEREALHVT